ncbi:multidrug and toxin extrusion protein 1 [Clupea harengus]|uniref:Multidrug and toxin extrusion protein n=1 Tax=Clupea harengus TaxID=7950 RepID=A0A6P3VUB8_CLUHA|nr:multidrug and toxin extrusion protein 1 [Clupea harengus]
MDTAGTPEALGVEPGAGQLTEETAASSKLFRYGWQRRLLPLVYREELYHVLVLAGPLLVSRILDFLLPFVITIACGHLGNAQLAGYGLASVTINVTTASTVIGLTLACDTLVSQTFGSKNLKRVGEILQRSTLIVLLFCLPCWAVLINAETILLALWQEPEVARIAQLYLMAYLPAVPAMFLHSLMVSYLQNQGIILPQMYTAAVANVINIAINYILIFQMELGVKGSAVANSLSQIIVCLLLFGYIHWKKLHLKTWGGWSNASLQEWGSFMRLAIPSTLMTCFEWWVYEIGGLLTGMLGGVDLAAQHVMGELGTISYMLPLGVSVAVVVRVGNALGEGNETRALITCKVALVLVGVQAVLQAIVIAPTKSFVAYIFTSDESIVEIVSMNLTVFIFLQFVDGLLCVSTGILVGSGKQKIAAVSNLICYYCIGLPVSIALMFKADLRVLGLWLGMFICIILQTCFFLTVIFKLDWRKVAEEAQKRAGMIGKVTCVGPMPPIDQAVVDALVPEASESPQKSPDTGATAATASSCSKENGYTAVSTEDQGRLESGKGGGEVQTPPQLSIKQLVLRRGLALLAAILALAVGVVIHLEYPPERFHIQPANWTLEWGNSTAIPTVHPDPTSPF